MQNYINANDIAFIFNGMLERSWMNAVSFYREESSKLFLEKDVDNTTKEMFRALNKCTKKCTKYSIEYNRIQGGLTTIHAYLLTKEK